MLMAPYFDASFAHISARLIELGADSRVDWDLTGITAFDSAAAMAVWRAWGRRRRESARVNPAHEALFARIAAVPPLPPVAKVPDWLSPIVFLGRRVLILFENLASIA